MPIEPPYGSLWREFKQGNIVAFLGAGASLSGRPPGFVWKEQSQYLPKGSELANWLADDAGFPSNEEIDRRDLAKVASFFEAANDRSMLRQRLREVFLQPRPVSAVHQFLAAVKTPLLIVTTNYDNLIEQAFEHEGRPYHLVIHPADQIEYAASVLWWRPNTHEPEPCPPTKLPLSLTDTTIIYKMHGGVNRRSARWDSFVITEEDYMDYLARMTGQAAIPARFMKEFRQRRFLFLGYGLADWNLRVILRNLRMSFTRELPSMSHAPATIFQTEPERAEPRRSWAIQMKPSDLEKWLWEKRQVNIYDMRIEEFLERMQRQVQLNP